MDLAEIRDVYDQLINSFTEVELKGKTMHYTSMNGNMFSFVSKDGEMGFRMTEEDKSHYIINAGAREMLQHNRVMNGYIQVTETMISNPEKLNEIFVKSIAFAKTLKPKTTKKRK